MNTHKENDHTLFPPLLSFEGSGKSKNLSNAMRHKEVQYSVYRIPHTLYPVAERASPIATIHRGGLVSPRWENSACLSWGLRWRCWSCRFCFVCAESKTNPWRSRETFSMADEQIGASNRRGKNNKTIPNRRTKN